MKKEKDICRMFWYNLHTLKQLNYFAKDFIVFHIANEQYSHPMYTINLKRIGLTSGIPDYCIIFPDGKVGFIEFKRNAKCKLSPNQLKFKNKCIDFKIPYFIAYTDEEAITFIKTILAE